MRDGEHDRIVAARAQPLDRLEAVLVLGLGRVDPRIVDVDLRAVTSRARCTTSTTLELRRSGQFSLNVRPITRMRASLHVDALADHQLRDALGDVDAHVVVDAPPARIISG